jgi:hypothetical protein
VVVGFASLGTLGAIHGLSLVYREKTTSLWGALTTVGVDAALGAMGGAALGVMGSVVPPQWAIGIGVPMVCLVQVNKWRTAGEEKDTTDRVATSQATK